ncbi:hypothetical protein [Sediminicurvatus halobius]|uniref:Uncharacterized protein n=1 Tax=Sediminicurvatus halobius TaxID=2182432 RepID=A0A2U2N0P5_9GAMM|nr:hypothetical protein [Spiribacter halobius]PWG62805.1 hypothetical protein DEM34_10565 [Spiribacter halobius]UEX77048.1 hypothetical protein LMH63_13990 [Spiribacter halobius]
MMLVTASILLVVAMLILRFGVRAVTRSPGGGWPDRLVEWIVAPGVTMLFAMSFGFAFEHFLNAPEDGHGVWPVVVSVLLIAALVVVWRRIPVARLPEPALTSLKVGPVTDPADRERAA